VLIISIDGLRPDLIDLAPMPILSALMQEGAYTLDAQTVHPSATLPAHASMLTGLCPDQHGVNWNDYIPENGYAQGTSIFTLAKQAGLYTVMIVNKEKLRQVTPPESTDYYEWINDRDVVIAEQAAPILKEGFDLAFVHFATTDAMGHVHGWLSPEQLSVVRRADEAIGTLLTALDEAGLREDTLIIVTADHGGHDDLHGTWMPQDMTIPWAVIGPEVIPQTITEPVNVTDTAATAAWALNLPSLPDAAGLPIMEAFGQASPPRADLRCP
jgi:predicted AlkP superfamily pyrophosphatase or phosphodiesterase